MYSSECLKVVMASSHNVNELLEGINQLPIENSMFLESMPTKESLLESLTDSTKYIFLTYYSDDLMGYSICDFRTTTTADFHWGVCRKHKYITKMIKQSFDIIKEMPVSFLGFVPKNNKLSKRITESIGFEYVGVIKNYCHDKTDALLYQYNNNGGTNG